MRGRALAKYLGSVLLGCVGAVLMAVPTFGQPVTVTLVGAGDIANCNLKNDEKTAKLIGNVLASPATQAQVITLGDNAYPSGTNSNFANCYDNYKLNGSFSTYDRSRPAWWGQYKTQTMPSLGNHEYLNSSDRSLKLKPYFNYFSGVSPFKGPAAPVPSPGLTFDKGYYSYDLGSWHIVALNSNDHCRYVSCSRKSAQAEWLRNDLTTNPSTCTLAYMHHPLYATGTGGRAPEVKPLVQVLYDQGADVILNAHNHRYERLARIDPNGNRDPVNGIRTITVGTGGEPAEGTSADPWDHSQIRIFHTPGIIRMDLNGPDLNNPKGSYSWKFVAVKKGKPSGKVMDSGTESCH
jgi:hypothetical protein